MNGQLLQRWSMRNAAAQPQVIDPNKFKAALRMQPSAVCIICAQHDGVRSGMTATAVCSLTADPPMLLVCVNRNASSHDKIQGSGRFSVNLLSREDLTVARRFSGGDPVSRFEVGTWVELASGSLALETALVTFDCSLTDERQVATHSIFIGLVEDLIVRPMRSPLIYLDGQYVEHYKHLIQYIDLI
jgi:flavin reductase (DIM6/NTAB) family NADH-FMN oxidoreductase RutF